MNYILTHSTDITSTKAISLMAESSSNIIAIYVVIKLIN